MSATEDLGVTVYAPGDVLPGGKIVGRPLPDGLGGFTCELIDRGPVFVTISQAYAAGFWGWRTVSNADASGLVKIERKP